MVERLDGVFVWRFLIADDANIRVIRGNLSNESVDIEGRILTIQYFENVPDKSYLNEQQNFDAIIQTNSSELQKYLELNKEHYNVYLKHLSDIGISENELNEWIELAEYGGSSEHSR